MSLQEPLFLLLLVLLPVAVLLYLRRERTSRAGRAAFASAAMMPSVVPVRPGWRRHLPIGLYLLALIVLVVALSRPQVMASVPVDQARVLLVTDQSGSMQATDVQPSRLAAVRRAAGEFLDNVPKRVQVGAVAYNQGARVIQGPTTDRLAVKTALAALTPRGSTATGDAIKLSLTVAQRAQPGQKPPPAAIVLLSDGKSVRGSDPIVAARDAREADVPIYTVSLGTPGGTIPNSQGGTTPVPPDSGTLGRIAEISGGQAFDVQNTRRLETVYEKLGTQITRKDEPRQITAGFAGGGLALLVLGAGASLLFFGRVP